MESSALTKRHLSRFFWRKMKKIKIEEFTDDEEVLELEDIPNIIPRQTIVDALKKRKLLSYGSIISLEVIEKITGTDEKDSGFEKWQFTLLAVRNAIRREGYFVSSRGKNGNLYILKPHEMPRYNAMKLKAFLANLELRHTALRNINTQMLEENTRKKIEFEILRNGELEIKIHEKLQERCSYKNYDTEM